MNKIVREVRVKNRRDEVSVVGYSSTDRGTRIVNGVYKFDTKGQSKKEVDEEIAGAIVKLLANQLGHV